MNPAAALITEELIKEFQCEKLQCSRHQTTDMKNHFFSYSTVNQMPSHTPVLSVFDCPFLGKNFGTFENIGNVRDIARKVTV